MATSPDPSPTATIETLKARAKLVQEARAFFLARGYWEADTPLLSASTVIDAHIDPIDVDVDGTTKFLQTSPELAMKRLLAAGSGSIFQFAHAFRAGESGHRHNREFTLLEWYKVDANLDELMREVADLTHLLTGLPYLGTRTYRDLFRQAVGIDPLTTPESELARLARQAGLAFPPRHKDEALNFLWADQVEPTSPRMAFSSFATTPPAKPPSLKPISTPTANRSPTASNFSREDTSSPTATSNYKTRLNWKTDLEIRINIESVEGKAHYPYLLTYSQPSMQAYQPVQESPSDSIASPCLNWAYTPFSRSFHFLIRLPNNNRITQPRS